MLINQLVYVISFVSSTGLIALGLFLLAGYDVGDIWNYLFPFNDPRLYHTAEFSQFSGIVMTSSSDDHITLYNLAVLAISSFGKFLAGHHQVLLIWIAILIFFCVEKYGIKYLWIIINCKWISKKQNI